MSHAWAEIDLDAVRHNVAVLKGTVRPWVELCAVVKANAYGHGAVAVARAALEAGAERLAVAFPQEGIELRRAGIAAPILLLGSLTEEDLEDVLGYQLIPSIWEPDLARALDRAARARGTRVRVHVDVDTGMSRLGVRWDEAVPFIRGLRDLDGLIVEGIYSHFSSADEADPTFSQHQTRRFQRVLEELARSAIPIPVVHMQNSAGTLNLEFPQATSMRPGLALYGIDPGPPAPAPAPGPAPASALVPVPVPAPVPGRPGPATRAALRPAMSVRSRIVQVKRVPAGTFVSYGRSHRTTADTHLATVSVGYADGYPRILSDRAQVLIGGNFYPVVGRVTMDHTIVDLGPDPVARPGHPVTLLGTDGERIITAHDLAGWAETISYEIVTGVSSRVPRRYHGQHAVRVEGTRRVEAHSGRGGLRVVQGRG